MITIDDAFRWGDDRIAFLADERNMFTVDSGTPFGRFLVGSGLVREMREGDQQLRLWDE